VKSREFEHKTNFALGGFCCAEHKKGRMDFWMDGMRREAGIGALNGKMGSELAAWQWLRGANMPRLPIGFGRGISPPDFLHTSGKPGRYNPAGVKPRWFPGSITGDPPVFLLAVCPMAANQSAVLY
jgi:hypothetical protein